MRARWNSEDFRRDVDAIRSDVAQLKHDLVSAMRDLISVSGEGFSDARSQLQEQVQAKLDALNEAGHDFATYGRKAVRQVQRHAEENPVQTALIVLGAAAVIGMFIMGGRRRDV
jgi:ElaB/YqjD/DUF883 family membrane-anchored ribosome-binding protein